MKPQPNYIEPKEEPTNIISTGGGSVMKGGTMSSPNFRSGNSGWIINADGSAEFQNINIGHKIISVPVGLNIQTAINLVNSAGGGEVFLQIGTHTLNYSITLYDNVTLKGMGIFDTIIDFNSTANRITARGTAKSATGTFAIDTGVDAKRVNGTTSSFTSAVAGNHLWIIDDWYEIASITDDTTLDLVDDYPISVTGEDVLIYDIAENVNIQDLTVKNSTLAQIYFIGCKQLKLVNVRSIDALKGIESNTITHCYFFNVECSGNSGDGFNSTAISYVTVDKCIFNKNAGEGIDFDALRGDNNVISNSIFNDNTNDGLRCGNSASVTNLKIIGNTLKNNGDYLTIGNTGSTHILIANNKIDGGISSVASDSIISNNIIYSGYSTNGIIIDGGRDNVIEGNRLVGCQLVLGSTEYINTVRNNLIDETYGHKPEHNQKIAYMKNTSGGALAKGDVVVLKAVAAGNEITTTTTQGDDLVYGMAAETIADNAIGAVIVEGYTVDLKVDGTADIAIGDFLATFTTAKIAAKAGAGDMAMFIALEAYTTDDSSGVIDALLIPARKI